MYFFFLILCTTYLKIPLSKEVINKNKGQNWMLSGFWFTTRDWQIPQNKIIWVALSWNILASVSKSKFWNERILPISLIYNYILYIWKIPLTTISTWNSLFAVNLTMLRVILAPQLSKFDGKKCELLCIKISEAFR